MNPLRACDRRPHFVASCFPPLIALSVVQAFAVRRWVDQFRSPSAARFTTGPLLHFVTTAMDDAISQHSQRGRAQQSRQQPPLQQQSQQQQLSLGSSTPTSRAQRLLVYSGHDTTIVPLLCALLAFEPSTATLHKLMPSWPVLRFVLRHLEKSRWSHWHTHSGIIHTQV